VTPFLSRRFPSSFSVLIVGLSVLQSAPSLLAAQPRHARHCFGDPVTAYIDPTSDYPAALRHRDISGRLRLFLRADGSVDHIVFEQRFGYSSLEVAAVDAFRKWKFPPEKKCDIVTIPVTFTLKKMPHLKDLTNR
jgi:TonB family protein